MISVWQSILLAICYLGQGIQAYLMLERAARALASLRGYYERRNAILSSDSSK